MATVTLGNYDATADWVDLVAESGFSTMNAVDSVVQNFGSGSVCVWPAGGSAPTPDLGGIILAPFDSVQLNAANIWVKAMDGSALISGTTL